MRFFFLDLTVFLSTFAVVPEKKVWRLARASGWRRPVQVHVHVVHTRARSKLHEYELRPQNAKAGTQCVGIIYTASRSCSRMSRTRSRTLVALALLSLAPSSLRGPWCGELEVPASFAGSCQCAPRAPARVSSSPIALRVAVLPSSSCPSPAGLRLAPCGMIAIRELAMYRVSSS